MSVIFYFSGTGNSLAAAKTAAGALARCRLETMPDYLDKPYEVKDECVGFVCPVYCFALPPIVQEFLKAFRGTPRYTFAIITMGANQGRALFQLREMLKEKNVELDYAEAIAMPDNIFITPPKKAAQMLAEAAPRLKEIAANIASGQKDTSKCVEKPLWKNIGIPLGYWFMKNVLKIGNVGARVNRCTCCGLCAKVCPVGNIEFTGRPHFGDKCAWCFGCRNWCPALAIRIGGMRKKADERYTHPDIKIQEMFRKR